MKYVYSWWLSSPVFPTQRRYAAIVQLWRLRLAAMVAFPKDSSLVSMVGPASTRLHWKPPTPLNGCADLIGRLMQSRTALTFEAVTEGLVLWDSVSCFGSRCVARAAPIQNRKPGTDGMSSFRATNGPVPMIGLRSNILRLVVKTMQPERHSGLKMSVTVSL